MKSNKIFLVAIIALIAIISVGSCSAGFLDFLGGDNTGDGTITIECNDTTENGQLMIIEFKDIQQNENGTYNTSQFGNDNGEWNGHVVYIPIENGKAEYNMSAGTEMFAVDSYITNLTTDYELGATDTPVFDVKYLYSGNELLTSSEQQYGSQCDVSFGGDIYYLNGTGLTEDDICIDLPNLQKSYDNVMSLYNITDDAAATEE